VFVYGAVVLEDPDALGARLAEVAHGVIAHVAEALHDERLVLPSGRQADLGHVVFPLDEEVDAVKDAQARGVDAAGDAALVDGLARHGGGRVDVRETCTQPTDAMQMRTDYGSPIFIGLLKINS